MPDSCCAVGCTNRRNKNNQLEYYRIPRREEKQKLWLRAIKRDNWSAKEIANARICSAHFNSGKL